MKNQLWGYIRPCHSRGKYLLLGVITATVLLWSITAVPAVATAAAVRHPGLVQDRILDSGVAPGAPQNDGKEKDLALSLPFAVDSQWTSVSDNTAGIIWQTNLIPPLPEGRLGGVGELV